MACNSDYMNPTHEERNKQQVCEHLVYAANKYMVGLAFDAAINEGANSCYGASCLTLDYLVKTLCELVTKLDQDDIYSDHSKYGLKLALWWTEHQEADKSRLAQEHAAKVTRELRASALAKLNPLEKRALGVDEDE